MCMVNVVDDCRYDVGCIKTLNNFMKKNKVFKKITSTYSSKMGGPPLEFININLKMGGLPLGTISMDLAVCINQQSKKLSLTTWSQSKIDCEQIYFSKQQNFVFIFMIYTVRKSILDRTGSSYSVIHLIQRN